MLRIEWTQLISIDMLYKLDIHSTLKGKDSTIKLHGQIFQKEIH